MEPMLSFRDGAQVVSAESLQRELSERVRTASASAEARLGLLLRAGELESALEDLEHPAASRARELTDQAAEACRTSSVAALAGCWRGGRIELDLPPQLRLRRPEGYAYYALQPMAYARLLQPCHEQAGGIAVVGVRSIGTSLSAVVLAELRSRQIPAQRITVRPTGHPWDRQLAPSAAVRALTQRSPAGLYVIVDEGPGLSGSTFLAVAEGLERYGVARERIELWTSHRCDPARLVARDAQTRWSRYRTSALAPPVLPNGARDLSAGAWRAEVYASELDWPACQALLERHKYRESSGALLKFVGLPPYGDAPFARGQLLAAAGFSPPIEARGGGYLAQRWIDGRPLRGPVTGRAPLRRLLEYLVFRSRECRAEDAPVSGLEQLLRVNVAEAIGWDVPRELEPRVERPVYADARLAPHEWIETPRGELYKVDATDHGDDHSFPGPCDSGWDIAGAILEWRLTPALASELCAEYRFRTGDDVGRRLAPYLLAYASLQIARGKLAALSAAPAEQPRLDRELGFYTDTLRRLAGSNGKHEGPCGCSSSC
jgi:hypothetical protein